jgi:hypothetical protein
MAPTSVAAIDRAGSDGQATIANLLDNTHLEPEETGQLESSNLQHQVQRFEGQSSPHAG